MGPTIAFCLYHRYVTDDKVSRGHFGMGLAFSFFIVSKLRSCLPGGNVYCIYMHLYVSVYDCALSAVEVHPAYIIQVDEVVQYPGSPNNIRSKPGMSHGKNKQTPKLI